MAKHILILLLMVHTFLFSWKQEFKNNFSNSSYLNIDRKITDYLSRIYPDQSQDDQKMISIMLSYFYSKLNFRSKELFYIMEFFDNLRAKEADFMKCDEILPDSVFFELGNFYNKWIALYPLIMSVDIVQKESLLFELPNIIPLNIELLNEAKYSLYIGDKLVREGNFLKGANSIPLIKDLLFENSNYYLHVVAGDILIKKHIVIKTEVSPPEGFIYSNGSIFPKDNKFMEESVDKDVIEYSRKFNKKYFYKHSLIPALAAGCVFGTNKLLIEKKLNDNHFSHSSASLYKGMNISFNVLSAGLLAKSVINYFKSYDKIEKKSQVKQISNEAKSYNDDLKKSIDEASKSTKVSINISLAGVL